MHENNGNNNNLEEERQQTEELVVELSDPVEDSNKHGQLYCLKALKTGIFLLLLTVIITMLTLCIGLYTNSSASDTHHGYLGGFHGNKMTNTQLGVPKQGVQRNDNVSVGIPFDGTVVTSRYSVNNGTPDVHGCHGASCIKHRNRRSNEADLEKKRLSSDFKKYENCLKAKKDKYDSMYEQPEVILAVERQPITLGCDLCVRPDQKYDHITWRFFPRLGQNITWQTIKIDKESEDDYELTPAGDLMLKRPLVEGSGRYVCYGKEDTFEAVYHVDVLASEPTVQVFGKGIPGKKVEQSVTLETENLLLFSKWTPWTRCNSCNKRGQRMRHGTCTVKILDVDVGTDYDILATYPDGLPCRSTLVPIEVRRMKKLRLTASQNELEYCSEPCATPPPLTKIKDEHGNVVEVVETGKGFLSMRTKAPKMPPMVKRKTFYETRGTTTILECPSGKAAHSAIRWQNNTQILDSVKLAGSSNGRVSIDVYNRLIIRKLADCDTAVYSCWIDGRHVATLKVRVIGSNKTTLGDKITVAGVSTSLALVLYIGFQVRKQHRQFGKALV